MSSSISNVVEKTNNSSDIEYEEVNPNSILWTTAKRWTTPHVVKTVTFGKSSTLSLVGAKFEEEIRIKDSLNRESWLESLAKETANERQYHTDRNRLRGRGLNTDRYDDTFVYASDPVTLRNTIANNERMTIDGVNIWMDSSDDEEIPQESDRELAEIVNTDCIIS